MEIINPRFLPELPVEEFVPGAQSIFDDRFNRVYYDMVGEVPPEVKVTEGLLEGTCTCDDIQKMVADAEGSRPCVYIDSVGHPTVGIGFNMDRSDARSVMSKYGINYDSVRSGKTCLTQTQITQLFNEDLGWAKPAPAKYISGFSNKP